MDSEDSIAHSAIITFL